MVERRYVHLKVLRDDFLRDVRQPVSEQERVVLAEGPRVENEEKFGTVFSRVLGLDGVRLTGWEIPEVSLALKKIQSEI